MFMCHLDAVVGVLVLAVGSRGHELTFGRGITAKPIGRNLERHFGLGMQKFTKEAFSGLGILAFLNKDFDKVTVLINGAPQISTFSLNRDDDLVEEPPVASGP